MAKQKQLVKPSPLLGIEAWGNRFITLYGLIAATIGGAMSGYFGINGGLDPFVFFSGGMVTFTLIIIALGIGRTDKMRKIAAGGVMVIMALGGLYNLRHQNRAEAAEKKAIEVERQNYSVEADGVAITLAGDENQNYAVGATISFEIRNDNDFPVWIRLNRIISSVENKISDSNREVIRRKIKPNSVFGVADNFIYVDKPMQKNTVSNGYLDVHFCYGRDVNDLVKDFTYKGPLSVRLDVDGNPDLIMGVTDFEEQTCNSNK